MKYIGNKTRLLDFIQASIPSFHESNSPVFADLFSGTGSVGSHFKKLGFKVFSNDLMTYSYAQQVARVEMNQVPAFSSLFSDKKSRKTLSEVLGYLNSLPASAGWFTESYSPYGAAKRQYFSVDNAMKIDSIRDELSMLAGNRSITMQEFWYLLAVLVDASDYVANMSGTYGAYLKIWRGHALKKIELKPIEVFDNGLGNKAFQKDANELVRKISGDVLYLDPPYNQRQYASNFHVLESLAVWDKPTLRGVTGLRNYDHQKSLFSLKNQALPSLIDIYDNADFKYIALSYNNEGLISHEQLVSSLENRGDLKVFSTDYRRFRTERDHEKRNYQTIDNKTKEYLFLLERK
jgi:adenine-specific DNA-methyltransferase